MSASPRRHYAAPLEHVALRCSVAGCTDDASYWFDAARLFGASVPYDAFYLCREHANACAPECSFVAWIDPATHVLRATELTRYACSEHCAVCND